MEVVVAVVWWCGGAGVAVLMWQGGRWTVGGVYIGGVRKGMEIPWGL